MHALKLVLRLLGYLWSLPHALFGLLLLCTVYFPRSIRWHRGVFEVVVRWHLIPRGMDRTGDGDIDDPEDFRTGGQTHAWFVFLRDEEQRKSLRLGNHERMHTVQEMIFGPLYPVIYGLDFFCRLFAACLRDDYRDVAVANAYYNIWFERWARRNETRLHWLLR